MASQSSGGTAHPSELVSDQVSGAFKKGRQSSSPDDRSDFQANTQNSGKLPGTVKSNISSEMCEHLVTYDLKKLQQQLQDAGIESSVTDELIQVRWNPKETETLELILNEWRHRAHNIPQDEFCSTGPDQCSQKGRVEKSIKDDRSQMGAGSYWADQFHQKGIDDKRSIKDGRQEPHGAGKAMVDVGIANKPDRKNGINQKTDLEAGSVEHFFDENPSFYIDANIADILFSEMSSEMSDIEESGVKLHHDNGVITITGRYLLAELDSVKHRLEALATSVHTKGFYHDCSSRYRCIQSDSIQEILNQAKTKVWFENVKPSQVSSKYLAKGISVNVYHGSVIGQLSDAIVYPVAHETGQCVPSGPAAHQLYQYVGEDFQRNIRFSKNTPWGSQFFSHQVPRTSYRRICLLCVTDWLTNSPHNKENIVERLYHIIEYANREANVSSLAIPIELGCRIPPLQVLDFIMKAINKYLVQQPEYRKLWRVSLVVTDARYLQQVRQVLDNWKYKEIVQQPHKGPLDVDVSMVKGSLFDQRVDAIVVTVHKTLDQSKGDLAMELRRRGGKALEEQCKHLIPNGINPAEAVAVTAGDLNMCKHVILGYLPKNVKCDKKLCLKLLLENIFKATKTHQVKSLAVPAIGSGALNYPTQMCVTEILRSCFIYAQECGVQTVNLIVDDQQLYQEFDGYLWKYQENMETINESQKQSEEVISAYCNDPKVTISDTDHFGSFADMVIFHLDGSGRQDDKFVYGLESRHLHSHPWICEKVHITEEEYEGQYKEAFKIANNKTVQLITLIWKGVEYEGQDILQKILSIVELMRRELSEHFLKVKLHVIVSQELKRSILDVIRSDRTSRFPSLSSLSSFRSYISGFVGNKISWKIETRPKKQFSAMNGINLVAVSRDSKLLETYTNTLAQRLQEFDQQYCEKYKPEVPPRPEQTEYSDQVPGSFMKTKHGSSPKGPRNAQSDTSNNSKQSPTDKDLEPGSRTCNYPGQTTSRGHSGGAGAMQQSPTFIESRPKAVEWKNPVQSASRGHTGGAGATQQSPTFNEARPEAVEWKNPVQSASRSHTGDARATQQSPTFNESRPKALKWNIPGQTSSRGHTGGAGAMQQSPPDKEWTQQTFEPVKTGSKNYMSMSSYDGKKRHETDNDRHSLSRSHTHISPTSLQPNMDRRADFRKDVTGKRTITTEDVKRKTINDEASQMNIAETLGTWKSPYEFDLDPQNEGSVKVLVYKHDITLCTVDAIVSVWTPPHRQQGRIAAAIERQVGTCPVTSIKDLENYITDVPKDLKTNFKSVIYANTPRFKNEDQFKRELQRCIQNIFRSATKNKHRIRSIALPVLGLGPGSTPETCCEILVQETFKACNVSKPHLGSLCKIHLIGSDEVIVYVLKDLAEQKLKYLAEKDKQCGEWSKAGKKGSYK